MDLTKFLNSALVLITFFALLMAIYYGHKFQELKEDLLEAQLEAEAKRQAVEATFQAQLQEAQEDADTRLKTVQDNYNRLVAELDADRVRISATCAAKSAATSSAPSRASSTSTGRSHAANERLAQRVAQRAAGLEAELLKVSRDCDALAVRFNSLLSLYQSYQKELTNGQH